MREEEIDGYLRMLAAVHRVCREREVTLPMDLVDALLDERTITTT